MDRRSGVGRPPSYPFNLNIAVDLLLKKEFDQHRKMGTAHPIMVENGIDAIPFQHENLDQWRENFQGIQHLDNNTNFLVTGAVDDVWCDPKGNLIIIDYKATSRESKISMDGKWYNGYRQQMEVYQWLFRENGFKVSNTGYFLFCNANRHRDLFEGKLEFDMTLIAHEGNSSWIPETLLQMHECLMENHIPKKKSTCSYCAYREAANDSEATSDALF